MASRSTESLPVTGRVDRDGRLVAADAPLERLQVEAGSALGRALALPQIAALARAVASLGVPLSRALVAADREHDLELFIRAEPAPGGANEDGDVLLTIERWVARPMAPPRLTVVDSVGGDERRASDAATLTFDTDVALNLIDLSPALGEILAIEPATALGRPLTSILRLIEEADGSMPLLGAVATRSPLNGQRAVPRDGGDALLIDAEPSFDEHGRFDGLRASVRRERQETKTFCGTGFEESLDEALRSPLARIITAADHIVERGDGPLRTDYATYASDIAAAGRHLLSVIQSMGKSEGAAAQRIDLRLLAAEAVGLIQPAALARDIKLELALSDAPTLAQGEARGVVQVLVNILGNAVRHSPEGGAIQIMFERTPTECRVTIADEGPGIAEADQQRIFERYERVGDAPDGSGLGLAIARRLARSMGGDVRLDSTPGEGARFTLALPV